MERSERHKSPLPTAWKVVMMVAVVATFLCSACVLWACLTAFDDGDVEILAAPVVALAVLIWLVLTVIAGVKYMNWWRWGLLVPVCIIGTIGLTEIYAPGRIGWMTAHGDMGRAASACEDSDDRTIGIYDFVRVRADPDGLCVFVLARYYPGVKSGFMYFPNGKTLTSDIDHTYVYLGDNWYYFR